MVILLPLPADEYPAYTILTLFAIQQALCPLLQQKLQLLLGAGCPFFRILAGRYFQHN